MNKILNYKQIYLFFAFVLVINTNARADEPDSTTTGLKTSVDSLQVKKITPAIFYFDSTFYRGSNYGSFADVFGRLPGAFFFNRGSVGQPAYGFLDRKSVV